MVAASIRRLRAFPIRGLNSARNVAALSYSNMAPELAIHGEAIIDGEVVVVHEGRTNFSEPQAELAAGRQAVCLRSALA